MKAIKFGLGIDQTNGGWALIALRQQGRHVPIGEKAAYLISTLLVHLLCFCSHEPGMWQGWSANSDMVTV